MAAASIVIDIIANMKGFNAGMASGSKSLRSMATGMQQVGAQMSMVGVRLAAFGAAVGGGLAWAAKSGVDFQKEMSAVMAISGATGSEFEALSNKAKELGITTEWSASQAANGMRFLAMAGFNTTQIISAMPGVLALASAGSIDLGRAADISSNILTGFGLAASQMNMVADVMATTITNSNTNILEMGEAMKYVAPVAGVLGISIQETAAAVGMLANAGIKGSLAGTGLRRAMARLAQMTKETRKALAEAGVAIEDVDIKVKSLREVMEAFRNSTADIGDILNIFGQRAGPVVQVLITATQQFDRLKDSIDAASGSALKMQGIMINNVAGSLTIIKSKIEGIRIAFFEAFSQTLHNALQSIWPMLQAIQEWIETNKTLVSVVVAVGAGIAAISVALGTVLIILGQLVTAAAAFAIMWSFIGPVAGAILAAGAAIASVTALIVLLGAAIASNFKPWIPLINKVKLAMQGFVTGFMKGISVLVPIVKGLGVALGWVATAINAILPPGHAMSSVAQMLGILFGVLTAALLVAATAWGVYAVAQAAATMGLSLLVGAIVAGLVWLGTWVAALFTSEKAMTKFEKSVKELEDMDKRKFEILTDKTVENIREASKNVGEVVSRQKEYIELLGLATSGQELSVQKEKRLLELSKEFLLNRQEQKEEDVKRVVALKKYLTLTEKLIAAAEARGDTSRAAVLEGDYRGALAALKEYNESTGTSIMNLEKLRKLYGDSNQEMLDSINLRIKEMELADKMAKSAENLNKVKSEYLDILEEIHTSTMNTLEKEIYAIEKKLETELWVMDEAKIAAEDKYNWEVAMYDKAVRAGNAAAAAKAKTAVDAALAEKNAVNDQHSALTALRKKNMQEERKEQLAAQDKINQDLNSRLIKQSGDRMAIVRDSARREREARDAEIAKEFIGEGSGKGKAAQDQAAALKKSALIEQQQIQAEADKIADESAKKAAAASNKAAGSRKSALSVLQKQVTTMREWIKLLKIRQSIERRYRSSIRHAINERDKLNKAEAAGMSGKALERARARAEAAKTRVDWFTKILGADPTVLERIGAPEAKGTQVIRDKILVLRDEIILLVQEIKVLGGEVGQAFCDGLKPKIEECLQYIRDAMLRLKNELNVDTKHSPSLRDVVTQSSNVVADAFKSMGESIGRAPNLSPVSNAIKNNVSAMGASSMSGGTFTDNRNMNMTVNNKYDLDEMLRQVNQRFNRNRAGVS